MEKTYPNWLDNPRTAKTALWVGIAFSATFTALIWWGAQRLASTPQLPDQGPAWYYWKLATPPSGRISQLGCSMPCTRSRCGR